MPVIRLPGAAGGDRLRSLLTVLLIGLAALRVFYFVLHDPMFGYGNQFDMGRTAACLDLWPQLPGGPRDIGYFEAPVEKHRIVKIESQQCYPGVEAAFDRLALELDGLRRHFTTDPDQVDMRAIGLFKAVLLLAAVWRVNAALRVRPGVALIHASILLIVIADPLNTLYLNTLYGEFFAVLGAYLATAGIAALVINRTRSAQTGILLLLGAGVLCLAFSRMQHVLLPIFFIVLFAMLKFGGRGNSDLPHERRIAWLVIAVLGLATIVSIASNLRFGANNPVFHEVNRSNMLFGALLPASNDPENTARTLGLPQECVLLSNSSYFRIAARGLKGACPEALAIPPLALFSAFAVQPRVWATVFGRGLLLSSGWRLPYVGEVARGNFEKVRSGPLGLSASLSGLSRKLDFSGHAIFWLLPLWAGLVAGLSLAWGKLLGRNVKADGDTGPIRVVLFCLTVIIISVWVSALFGDGYSELARHLHLGIVAALVSWLIAIVVAVRYRPVLPLIVVSLLVLGSLAILRQLPLTMGALSEPAEDRSLVGATTFGGWLVTPDEIIAVDLEQQHRLLRRVAVSPSAGLGRMHPMAAGSKTLEFRAARADFPDVFDPDIAIDLYAVRADGGRERLDIRYPCARMTGCR